MQGDWAMKDWENHVYIDTQVGIHPSKPGIKLVIPPSQNPSTKLVAPTPTCLTHSLTNECLG